MTQHTTAKGYPYPDDDEALAGGAAAIQRLAEFLDRAGLYAAAKSDPGVTGAASFRFDYPAGWFGAAPAVTVGVELQSGSGLTFTHRIIAATEAGCTVIVTPNNMTSQYGVRVNIIAVRRNA